MPKMDDGTPYVVVDDAENPPWGNDRTCPVCGEKDLPLEDSDPPMLTFIKHCGKSWVRGPLKMPPK